MPINDSSAGDRTQRIRQIIVAGSTIPPGGAASTESDVIAGRIWRLEDECCTNPYMIAFVDQNTGPTNPLFTRLMACTLYEFPAQTPVGTVITFYNATGQAQEWQAGNGPLGPFYQAAVSSATPVNQSQTYTTVLGDGVVSMYFGGDSCN